MLCDSCFTEKYGKKQLEPRIAEYYGGHKAFLGGGYFTKFQSGTIFLTDLYLIFLKGGKEPTDCWEIVIPLNSVIIDKWTIEEESRRKHITGGGVALGESGAAIGGGAIHDAGKAHHILIPYVDENGIPQEPRFGISSLGGKAIREWSSKIYELIVQAKKINAQRPSMEPHAVSKTTDDPMHILKMRLVKGEISLADYEKLRKLLEN